MEVTGGARVNVYVMILATVSDNTFLNVIIIILDKTLSSPFSSRYRTIYIYMVLWGVEGVV